MPGETPGHCLPMLSYETLDTIADSYIPLLLVCLAGWGIVQLSARRTYVLLLAIASVFLSAILVYGLGFVDQHFSIWHSVALDYSTHTAASLALVVVLTTFVKPLRWAWISSLLLYFALMRYQRYHSFIDIFTTSAVLIGPLLLLNRKLVGLTLNSPPNHDQKR